VKQVFISHDTDSDGQFANRLAKHLDQLGVEVWIAPASIRPGEQWIDAIGRGLESSTHFALISTPRAYMSTWVKKEYNAALLLQADEQIEVIPLEVEKAKIPLFLREFQLISFREDYESGLRQLADLLGVAHHLSRIPLASAGTAGEESPVNQSAATETAVPRKEPRIFFAYDVRDREYANRLRKHFENHGIKTWIAPDSIDAGTRWEVAIVEAVVDSTAIVVIMTPNSSRSRWVQNEILVAKREGIPLFPILLAGAPFESLRSYQFIDARGGEMPSERFVERLKS
jgi:hypothetical protein